MSGPLVSEAEKAEVWRRRAVGEPVWMIARHMGRSRRTVRDLVAATGGLPPRRPQRSPQELTVERSCRAAWRWATLAEQWRADWAVHRRRCHAKSGGTEAARATELPMPMQRLSIDDTGRR